MGRLFVRMTIILTSLYMMISYILSHFFDKDIIGDWYVILYEIVIIIYCFSEGKFHCKYVKFLAFSNLMCDTAMRFDRYTMVIETERHDFIPFGALAFGLMFCAIMSILHFSGKNNIKKHKDNDYGKREQQQRKDVCSKENCSDTY